MLEQVVPRPEVWDQEWTIFFFSFGYNLGVCSDIEFFLMYQTYYNLKVWQR